MFLPSSKVNDCVKDVYIKYTDLDGNHVVNQCVIFNCSAENKKTYFRRVKGNFVRMIGIFQGRTSNKGRALVILDDKDYSKKLRKHINHGQFRSLE